MGSLLHSSKWTSGAISTHMERERGMKAQARLPPSTLKINTALPYPLMGAAVLRGGKSKVKRQVVSDTADGRKSSNCPFIRAHEILGILCAWCLEVGLGRADGSVFKQLRWNE